MPGADVSLSIFGGLCTEMAASDLPEGASPLNWDVDYLVGSVQTRDGLQSVYSFGAYLPLLWLAVDSSQGASTTSLTRLGFPVGASEYSAFALPSGLIALGNLAAIFVRGKKAFILDLNTSNSESEHVCAVDLSGSSPIAGSVVTLSPPALIGHADTYGPGRTWNVDTELNLWCLSETSTPPGTGSVWSLSKYNTSSGSSVSIPIIPTPATITGFQISSNVVTIFCTNTFRTTDSVFIYGLTTGTYLNGALFILSCTGAQFTANFIHADVGLTIDSGNAKPINEAPLGIASFEYAGQALLATALQHATSDTSPHNI